MPYVVRISLALRKAGWTVKIYDNEAREPPHVTIQRRAEGSWRVSLRDGGLLDENSKWKDVPPEIRAAIVAHRGQLVAYWNERTPTTPYNFNS